MSNEKKYSAQEAAMAVLAKAKELLAKSSLTKEVKEEVLKKSAEFTSGLHTVEYYEPLEKAAKMKKDDSSIQAGISGRAAQTGGGGNVPVNPGVSSALGGVFKSDNSEKKELNKKYEGFKAVEESARESGARDPEAVAAAAGRKKYGKEKFQHAAAAGKKMGKTENPDEKEDAKLGEDVEHLCEDHMLENKDAEKKEGHKIVQKSECIKCMTKGESKHDRCVEHVKENSPDVKNPHAVCVAEGVTPASWEKSEFKELYEDLAKMEILAKGVAQPSPSLQMKEKGQDSGIKEKPSDSLHPRIKEKGVERDYKDFETKPGNSNSSASDHREEEQKPPQANPKEEAEGNNPPAGSVPGKGLHKLMYFKGHTDSKKKLKKGICLG